MYLLYNSKSERVPVKLWKDGDKYKMQWGERIVHTHQNLLISANEVLAKFYLYGGYGSEEYSRDLNEFVEKLKEAEQRKFYVAGSLHNEIVEEIVAPPAEPREENTPTENVPIEPSI